MLRTIPVCLSRREEGFWTRALRKPLIVPDFDECTTSEIVQTLQNGWRETGEEKFWAEISSLVRQLQEARGILRKMGLCVAEEEKIVESCLEESILPASPILPISPPPSVKAKTQFCGNDVSATITVMKTHPMNELLQLKGCQAFTEMIKEGKKRRLALEENPVGSWTCPSCRFRNSPNDEKCRMCQVSERFQNEALIVHPNKERLEAEQINSSGGVGLILEAMRRFSDSKTLQRASLFALAQLVQEESSTIDIIANAGGISDIVTSMIGSPSDEELQTQGIGILANPAIANDEVLRIDLDSMILAVLSSMKMFPHSERVQAFGCLCIANASLKSDALTHTMIFDEDYACHKLIIQILEAENFEASSRIAAAGLWALLCLTRELCDGYHMSIRGRVSQNGAVRCCMRLLAKFPSKQGVQTNGLALVRRLGISLKDESTNGCIVC